MILANENAYIKNAVIFEFGRTRKDRKEMFLFNDSLSIIIYNVNIHRICRL